jgi:hypothetical protein
MSIVQGPADPAVLLFDPTRPMAGQTVQRLAAHPRGTFYPRAWSPDGDRLAGTIANTIVVYKPKTGQYAVVAESTPVVAAAAMGWLPDNRRLLVSQERQILLVDTVTGENRPIYSAAPDRIRGFSLSAARNTLYVSRGPEEADIWIATIQSQ